VEEGMRKETRGNGPDSAFFERVYKKFNRKEFIHPDPLEFVYRYESGADRETAGFIAAALAYGNVRQILASVTKVLSPMGPFPARWLREHTETDITRLFLPFKHRFTTGAELAVFLGNIRTVLRKYGSLEECFSRHYRPADEDLSETIYAFVNDLNSAVHTPTLTPCPEKKSSFKRMNLFLRWMVRGDAVDPGVWKRFPPAKLIVPLDTHMFRIARELGLTGRRDTSMRTALEITSAFRRINPLDPVKYDFSLTRTGILRAGRGPRGTLV
jgi:uncharacterized protein (TIGR02757 family)